MKEGYIHHKYFCFDLPLSVILTSKLVLIASKWAPLTFIGSISAEFIIFVCKLVCTSAVFILFASTSAWFILFVSLYYKLRSAQSLFAPVKPLRNSVGMPNGSKKLTFLNISASNIRHR